MSVPTPAASADARTWSRRAPWLWLVLGLVVVAATYRSYGPTWDEGLQSRYGELCLQYFRSGGQDTACNRYEDLRFYGPLIEMVPALAYTPGDPARFDLRHLFFGLLGWLSLPAVWLLARRFGDPRVALFAIPAVATLPRFCGHWFNNSKDAPFAVSVVWLIAVIANLFSGPRVRWRDAVWCGVAMGLALCVRPGGMPLFLMFVAAGAGIWLIMRPPGAEPRAPLAAAWRLVPKLLIVPLLAWPIMVAPWPWAHEAPIRNPLRAMRVATEFATTVPMVFDGVKVHSDHLPWYYVAKYVLIGTPLSVLALAGLGLLVGIRGQLADWTSERSRAMALVQVWLFAPLVLFAVLRPNIYGGMRHFMFVLPALGVFAGVGAAAVVRVVDGTRLRGPVCAAMLALILLPVIDLVRLYPYEMTFYNTVVGGVEGASGRYWTDYWASSYREAIEWVNRRAAATPARRTVLVLAAGPSVMVWARDAVADNVDLQPLHEFRAEGGSELGPGQFYIGTTRNGLDRHFPEARVVHTIGREGAVFTVVKEGP